ncbi:hypothetical protein A9P82_07925 [Arachidicoccus ginsenosidimutans]|nr:hypothetical protein A9P82_07925 [Arachidicoccus sp. BS20]
MMKFFSGATFCATELGVLIGIFWSGLNLVVKIKKVNKRNATSQNGVISTAVLLRGNLALPIVFNLFYFINKMQKHLFFHKFFLIFFRQEKILRFSPGTNYL